jgi:hypothetical protein
VEYAGGAAEGRLLGADVAAIPPNIQLRKENILYHLNSTCTSNSLILFSQGFIYFTRISSENLLYFVKAHLFSIINITIRNQHLAATSHQQKEGMKCSF